MRESTALLMAQAARFWELWAPAVLACAGDPAREDAVRRRPGIAVARQAYDDTLAELQRREQETGLWARTEVSLASLRIDAALARSHPLP